jgi:molecular chaperone GrpE
MTDEQKKKSDKFTRSSEYLDHEKSADSKHSSRRRQDAAEEPAADLKNEIAGLKEELEKTGAKAAEFSEGWQRERADFQNYKRRVERDHAMLTQDISGRIIRRFLEVLDDLERAQKNLPACGDPAWAEGIELVNRKLNNLLESENVQRIEAENQQFDPTFHEALSQEESADHESGQIIEVIQQGYMLGDRVLRPARVRVAR